MNDERDTVQNERQIRFSLVILLSVIIAMLIAAYRINHEEKTVQAPSITKVQPELMRCLLAADLDLTEGDFADHETDLYVVAKPGVWEWLKDNYEFHTNVTGFMSQRGSKWNGAGKHCFDIPFAANWPTDPHRTPTTK